MTTILIYAACIAAGDVANRKIRTIPPGLWGAIATLIPAIICGHL